PGPPVDNFILGHYASYLNQGLDDAFAHLAKQYGGIVRYNILLSQPNILISDPNLIQKILVNCCYDYPKFFFDVDMVKEILGEGIAIVEGDFHKRQRKMMSPAFVFANVKEMFPTFVQASHKLRDVWIKQIGNKKEEIITITESIPKLTLDVIGLAGFNYEFNSITTTSESDLARAYNSVMGTDVPPLYWAIMDLFPFIRKLPTALSKSYYGSANIIKKVSERLVIEQKNSSVQGKDLLSLLIKENENLPVDAQITHNELVMTFLLAGNETVSIALAWTLYFLAKNPDMQDLLHKEILNVFTDRNHFPTLDEIEQLKYLECVFKETLRITPPVPALQRYNLKDEIMNGYFIPKGTPLTIPINAIHNDPSIWGDDAEYFNPSRWLNPEIRSKVTSNNFLPFSSGPKSCLGMKMAQLEFKSVLSIMIRNFKFRLVEGFAFKKKFSGLTKPIPGIDLWVSK
ncbi:2192_t:CDS:2, partial [Scutellospora calospora]